MIGVWVRLLRVPYRMLFPAILLFSSIGVYSVHNNSTEVMLTAGFAVLGYVFTKLGCEPAPLALGFVLAVYVFHAFLGSLRELFEHEEG